MLPDVWFMTHTMSTRWVPLSLERVMALSKMSAVICESEAQADILRGMSYMYGSNVTILVGMFPYDDNMNYLLHVYPYDPRLMTVDNMSAV